MAGDKRIPAVIFDSGAIIGLSRDKASAAAAYRAARAEKSPFYVPVVVLAETLRGGPKDAPVHRVLTDIAGDLPLSSIMARRAGRLLGETGSDAGAVDAIVAATAISMAPSIILTSDPDDLRHLTRDHPDVAVFPI